MGEPNFTNYRTKQSEERVAETLDGLDAEKIYFEQVRPRLIAFEEKAKQDSKEDWAKIVPKKGFPFSVGYDIDLRR